MNAEGRKILNELIKRVNAIRTDLESIEEEEQEKLDNLSDGLRATEKGQKLEEVVQALGEAATSLDDACSSMEAAAE